MNQTGVQNTIEARLVTTCTSLGVVFSAIGAVANWLLGGDELLIIACTASAIGFLMVMQATRWGLGISAGALGFFTVAGFLLVSTWEANGGVRGSTSVAIPGAAVLAVLTLPYRRSPLALASVLAFFTAMCVIELHDGLPAPLPFAGMAGATDFIVTTIATTVIAAAAVAVMRHRYEMALEELSEAKRRNEELAARAIAADQDKTRFMARMSHDLRTPLAAVLGSLELALTDPDRDDIIKLLRAARERSTDLQRLVGDLVDVESAGSDALCVIEKPVELASWLEQVKCEARPRSGVGVDLEHDPTLPPWVLIDSTRVGQILANLIDNACKHTDSGHIVLRAEASDGRLRLTVTDTGPGISARDLATLGLPFRQLDRGRERGGTGLGLYSAGQIARVVGGSLTLSSAPGSGTRAILELPLVAATPQPAELAKPMRLATPLKVLYADDEPVLREITTAMLESIGCTVVATDSGLQALAHASETSFDAVLLDIVMPEVDGLETARRLRMQSPTLPLIAMTANAFPEDAHIAAQAGFNHFLIKPVTPRQLYDALNGLVPTAAPVASE